MKASENAYRLIRQYEGLKLEAYQCPAGKWTIGYGHTKSACPGKVITHSEAEMFLKWDVGDCEDNLNWLKLPVNQNQYDALISWIFNLGAGNFRRSTLLKIISQDPNDPAIHGEWLRWNHAGGQVLDGLTRRRQAEIHLYELPV